MARAAGQRAAPPVLIGVCQLPAWQPAATTPVSVTAPHSLMTAAPCRTGTRAVDPSLQLTSLHQTRPLRALVRRHGLSGGLPGHGGYFRLRDLVRPRSGRQIPPEGNLCPWNRAKDADLTPCYRNRTYAVLLVNSGRQAVTTAVPLALGPSVAGEELHPAWLGWPPQPDRTPWSWPITWACCAAAGGSWCSWWWSGPAPAPPTPRSRPRPTRPRC